MSKGNPLLTMHRPCFAVHWGMLNPALKERFQLQPSSYRQFACAVAVLTIACSAVAAPTYDKQPFGTNKWGEAVDLYTLKNSQGYSMQVLTYGAIIYQVNVPDRSGNVTNVTANRQSQADYESRSGAFGAVVGRFANRIARGQFAIDGKTYQLATNNGPNHIHGGPRGFDKRVWKAEPIKGEDFAALKLSYTSADGEEGYPGKLNCELVYTWTDANELKMQYTATTDKPTALNLCNHAYWNLAGAYSGTVLDQVLEVNASGILDVDETLIPTGKIIPVAGTPFGFKKPRKIGERIGEIKAPQFNGGYDHCFVLDQKVPGTLGFCARLTDPKSGRVMEVWTTEPGVQVYSANFPGGTISGPPGFTYPKHAGVCLETQHFPDSPNHPEFPSTLLVPGQVFRSTTVHKFGVAADR